MAKECHGHFYHNGSSPKYQISISFVCLEDVINVWWNQLMGGGLILTHSSIEHSE